MDEPLSLDNSAEEVTAPPPLRAVRQKDPLRALGMAVQYLMRLPSFAAMRFGHWSRTLVGQINRGHYLFIVQGKDVVGFLGWSLASERDAEAWLAGKTEISNGGALTGDCMIINAWQASSPEVNMFILDQVRRVGHDLRMVYAKRFYKDGRWRPVKIRVNDFVDAHIVEADRSGP